MNLESLEIEEGDKFMLKEIKTKFKRITEFVDESIAEVQNQFEKRSIQQQGKSNATCNIIPQLTLHDLQSEEFSTKLSYSLGLTIDNEVKKKMEDFNSHLQEQKFLYEQLKLNYDEEKSKNNYLEEQHKVQIQEMKTEIEQLKEQQIFWSFEVQELKQVQINAEKVVITERKESEEKMKGMEKQLASKHSEIQLLSLIRTDEQKNYEKERIEKKSLEEKIRIMELAPKNSDIQSLQQLQAEELKKYEKVKREKKQMEEQIRILDSLLASKDSEIQQLKQSQIDQLKKFEKEKSEKNQLEEKIRIMDEQLSSLMELQTEAFNKGSSHQNCEIQKQFGDPLNLLQHQNLPTEKQNKQYQFSLDISRVLEAIKDIDCKELNEIIKMIQKEKLSGSLDFEMELGKYNLGELMQSQICDILKNLYELDFSKKDYSKQEFEQIRKDLIKKFCQEQEIIEFLKFLVHLTAIDERFIQCGSNAFNLLVEMRVDLREQCFENIRIRDTSLIGGNFVRCNFNGSEFDNVDISGVNLNQAQLFNCKWKNIKIHELNRLDGHSYYVRSVNFSPDGTTLASGSDDNSIRLWDVKTGQQKAKLDGHSEAVWSVNFSPDGTTLASGSLDNSICLWDVKTGQQKAKLDGHSSCVNSINFSPDGTTLASGSSDNSIRLWDVKTGQQKAKLDGHSESVRSVNFSPDGITLASGSDDNSIRLWDVKTGEQNKLDGHSESVASVNFSPDGTILASGSDDNSIRLWDVQTRMQKAQLDGHSNGILSVNFSPDCLTLASGSYDKSIRLWDVQTGVQKAQLDGHTHWVYSVNFSPDGTTLASGSYDQSIRLWEVQTGKQKAELDGHSGIVPSVNFSPDGNTLASGSGDKSIRFWDVKTRLQILPTDETSEGIVAQFKLPIFQSKILHKITNSFITILLISQQLFFQSKSAIILDGELVNHLGLDLRNFFQQRGSIVLSEPKEQNL